MARTVQFGLGLPVRTLGGDTTEVLNLCHSAATNQGKCRKSAGMICEIALDERLPNSVDSFMRSSSHRIIAAYAPHTAPHRISENPAFHGSEPFFSSIFQHSLPA
jgi:hypothetical protein